MASVLGHLEPKLVWKYFEEICEVPRPSKKEERIQQYLVDFAKAHNLEYREDELGNLNIKKAASKGMEKLKPVVLQSHMDMVGEKNADKEHNFETDPIEPWIDGDLVKAKGTTLGADDGIGIASQLAILASDEIEHGPIECLFTMDEETGLTGAFGLKEDFVDSRILINLDSEDWGELFIGCAGGRDTKALFTYKTETVPSGYTAFKLAVTGLQGGHSGDEIHKGLGNSIKILNRLLFLAQEPFKLRISEVDGGNMRNAIPREAFATVVIEAGKESQFLDFVNKFKLSVRKELSVTAPDLEVDTKKTAIPDKVIDKTTQKNLIMSLYACPHGEQAWSQAIDNLVETSTNLATLKMDNGTIVVGTSQRSSVESKLDDVVYAVQNTFKLAGARVESSDGYPGWEPDLDSEILDITVKSYKKLFGKDPEVKAIHAGLECGLIGKKYPGIDMISIGPDIKGAHTPEERISVQSTIEYWELLLDVLKHIPADK